MVYEYVLKNCFEPIVFFIAMTREEWTKKNFTIIKDFFKLCFTFVFCIVPSHIRQLYFDLYTNSQRGDSVLLQVNAGYTPAGSERVIKLRDESLGALWSYHPASVPIFGLCFHRQHVGIMDSQGLTFFHWDTERERERGRPIGLLLCTKTLITFAIFFSLKFLRM